MANKSIVTQLTDFIKSSVVTMLFKHFITIQKNFYVRLISVGLIVVVILMVIRLIVLDLYFTTSPYQACLRDVVENEDQIKAIKRDGDAKLFCVQETTW
jgi:hypothetical protein